MSEAKNIQEMVAAVIADGKLTQAEKKELDAFILADGRLSLDERKEIDKLLSLIARGELVVVDE